MSEVTDAARLPPEYQQMKPRIAVEKLTVNSGSSAADGKATVVITSTEPLYEHSLFWEQALGKGAGRTTLDQALARRDQLPADLQPKMPSMDGLFGYIVAKPVGTKWKGEATFTYIKQPRDWSFRGCFKAWTSDSGRWNLKSITWSPAPTDIKSLKPRAGLPANAVMAGEASLDREIAAYTKAVEAFVSSVDTALAAYREKTIQVMLNNAVWEAVGKYAKHPRLLSPMPISVVGESARLSSSGTAYFVCEADIEQTADLFTFSKEKIEQWPEFQADSRFLTLRRLASNRLANATAPAIRTGNIYAASSRKGTLRRGLFRFTITGLPEKPTVGETTWSNRDEINSQLEGLTLDEVEADALLETEMAGRTSVAQYHQEIDAFCEEASASLRRRFSDFMAGLADTEHFQGYQETYTAGFDAAWDAALRVLAERKIGIAYQNKPSGRITTEPIPTGPIASISYTHAVYQLLITENEQGTEIGVKAFLYIKWRGSNSQADVESKYRRGELFTKSRPVFRNSTYPGVWSLNIDDRAEAGGMSAGMVRLIGKLLGGQPVAQVAVPAARNNKTAASAAILWRFRDTSGKIHTSSEYAGRPVVVYYCGSDVLDDQTYFNSSIRGSAKQVGRVAKQHQNSGLAVFWIEDSMQLDTQRVKRVANRLGLNVPVVVKDEIFLWPHTIGGQPWAVVFDSTGRMVKTLSGANEVQQIASVIRSLWQ